MGKDFLFFLCFLFSFDRRCLDTQLTRRRTYASTELAHTHTHETSNRNTVSSLFHIAICSVSVLYDFPFCAGAFFLGRVDYWSSKPLSRIEVKKRG